ncbi:uncharacterized protein Z518_00668 [Rhinocladiella mackenziei CBS 650.93]|uniref:O-methyltransferase domain-containing protein n=1 Tax=Rhinocladiella mackenziei CBS 650.93 TaxID=1442369 RepID=A0A0D2HG25_9EURO|nr:uncharacterized protein Z518_00668 [Rhinocladiella mackenziei CBS 650.93]KIX09588.1 hypothetical protein Z518_00668 [Rhinocladiella mackenziei CBS 650.93]
MEECLTRLNGALELALKTLRQEASDELLNTIHNDNKLPDKKRLSLATKSVDMLYELEKLLTPGPLLLSDFFFGYMNTKCLCGTVELGIPDVLRKGPQKVSELASICGAREDRLRQVLRQLHNEGIYQYDRSSDSYSNNPASKLLISDHWTQWRNWVDLYGNEFYEMSAGIPASLRKDATRVPAQIAFDTDKGMFQYFSDMGWVPRLHRTLSGGAIAQAPGILEDYPWQEVADELVLDIGGGGGGLIALLTRRYPTMRGSILDLPRVIEEAKFNFHSPNGVYADVGGQVSADALLAGDFFQSIPTSQVYTMKWCLHDWDDDRALRVLSNIRTSIQPGPKSRVVVFESILGDGRTSRLSRYGNLNMMVAVGGQERDESHWRSLAQSTGWTVSRIFSLRNSWTSAIELVPSSKEPTGVNGSEMAGDHPAQSTNGHGHVPEQDGIDDKPGVTMGLARLPGRTVEAQMRFLQGPWDASKGNPFIRVNPADGYDYMNFTWADHRVLVTDARPQKDMFNLETHGFAYYDNPIDSGLVEAIRSGNQDTVLARYYPTVREFVKDVTGAQEVIIFDHTLRKRRVELGERENETGKEQPATMVHCDQSTQGAIRRIEQNLPVGLDLAAMLSRRVRMLNIWRPLNGPVEDWPLAQMDFRTCPPETLLNCDLLRGALEKRGQTVTFTHSDQQQWYYLDAHRTDEVTVIKIWDNQEGVKARLCPHAAFKHPDSPPNARPRESVEVRCIVIDKL